MRRGRLKRAGRAVLEDVAAALFPAACRLCGTELPEPDRSTLRPPRAARLRRPLFGAVSLPLWLLCAACSQQLRRPPRIGRLADGTPCVGAFEPAPAIFELVHALKYDGVVELAPWLGAHLASATRRQLGALGGATLVPIPLHASRLAERGFNQSSLLARSIGAKLRLPVHETLLERRRATLPQAKLPTEARAANVDRAFVRAALPFQASGPLLLVDDVVTSGATIRAARAALGCEVMVLTLCQARDPLAASDFSGRPGLC